MNRYAEYAREAGMHVSVTVQVNVNDIGVVRQRGTGGDLVVERLNHEILTYLSARGRYAIHQHVVGGVVTGVPVQLDGLLTGQPTGGDEGEALHLLRKDVDVHDIEADSLFRGVHPGFQATNLVIDLCQLVLQGNFNVVLDRVDAVPVRGDLVLQSLVRGNQLVVLGVHVVTQGVNRVGVCSELTKDIFKLSIDIIQRVRRALFRYLQQGF